MSHFKLENVLTKFEQNRINNKRVFINQQKLIRVSKIVRFLTTNVSIRQSDC